MAEFSAATGISRPTLSRFFNDPQSVRQASRTQDRRGYGAFRLSTQSVRIELQSPQSQDARDHCPIVDRPVLREPCAADRTAGLVGRILDRSFRTAKANPEQEAEAVATLISLKVAGAIVIPLGYASREGLFKQMGSLMPLVFLDARVDAEGAFVGTDNRQSMDLIVDYLLRSGSPPSYFDMPDVNQNARERRHGYEASMQERGAEPRIFPLHTRHWDFERVAFEEATRLLKTGASLGGTILCANDRIAFGVMAAVYAVGRGDRPAVRASASQATTITR